MKKDEDKSEQTLSKWPPVMPLPPALTTLQLTALFSKSQSLNRATGASSPMQNAFVLELSGGVLVHNQDGLFENFPLTPDAHIQRLLVSQFPFPGALEVGIVVRESPTYYTRLLKIIDNFGLNRNLLIFICFKIILFFPVLCRSLGQHWSTPLCPVLPWLHRRSVGGDGPTLSVRAFLCPTPQQNHLSCLKLTLLSVDRKCMTRGRNGECLPTNFVSQMLHFRLGGGWTRRPVLQ